MADIFSALLGDVPSDPAARQALVQELMRKRAYGELGQLSGDPILGPYGASQLKEADQEAENIGQQGRLQASEQSEEAYRQALESHQSAQEQLERDKLAELKRYHDQLADKAADDTEGLDDDTAKMASYDIAAFPEHMRNYASFGKVGQSRRDQINTGVSQILHDAGTDLSALPSLRATARAYATTVNKMGPQVANLASFSSLVDNNIDRLDVLVGKVNPSRFSTVNDWAQALERQGGSADAAELSSVLTTTQGELARLLTTASAGGNSPVSDSARKELQRIADGTLAPSAFRRVLGRLRLESQMKVQFANDQIANAQAGLTGVATGHPPGPFAVPTRAAPGGGGSQRVRVDAEGNIIGD
jgi:hypothetical protein